MTEWRTDTMYLKSRVSVFWSWQDTWANNEAARRANRNGLRLDDDDGGGGGGGVLNGSKEFACITKDNLPNLTQYTSVNFQLKMV